MKNMKKLIILLIIAFGLNVYGQDNQEVEFKWKVDKSVKLTYQTIIEQVDTSVIKSNVTLADIISPDSLTRDLMKEEEEKALDIDEFIDEMKKIYGNIKYVTHLTNKKENIIDIVTEMLPEEQLSNSEINKMDEKEKEIYIRRMAHLNQGVVLRGSIFDNGEIESFWLKNDQKNILSLFFRLPDRPVKIGDSWSIDVSLISGDHNFICDSSHRINKIILTNLEQEEDELIATVKYNIVQYAQGKYKAPLFGGTRKTKLKADYMAIAKFSITKGKWISYEGLLSYYMTGIKEGNITTRYALYEQK